MPYAAKKSPQNGIDLPLVRPVPILSVNDDREDQSANAARHRFGTCISSKNDGGYDSQSAGQTLDLLRLQLAQQEQQLRYQEQALRRADDEVMRLSRELVQTREQAEASSQAKSRFLSSMSHELRTPLHGILGYAQLLHLEGDLNSVQDARIDAMLAAGKHLLQMINKVLDLSQIAGADTTLAQKDFDLHILASNCLDVVKPACMAKGLKISLSIAPEVPRRMIADPTRLQQILLNLLGNAVKFTALGSVELRLRTLISAGSASSQILRIEVADTGAGIPIEDCRRLFMEFTRLEAAIVDKVEGSGLGLALSVHLANAMGGKLDHEDNAGGGSVFWLELPLAFEQTVSANNVEAEELALPDCPLRVLVVDDIGMNREIASAYLCSVGHKVVCADGGIKAVMAAHMDDFDVVLMDVRMPDVDGLEATRRIRAIEGRRGQVPIVALTALALIEQIKEFETAGMNGHLVKPYAPEALIAVAEQAAKAGRSRGRALK
ncbi:ATP-binding protein [Lichenifustis flavocetrariae]|uniref:histidine kinase n=1 Tax=Lichenifustis flavocetrariae TaxID=2949735 RepID=A0AA42CQZ8_9HYPH|nr:ATP-binding protein [Lichenifustis flavocetrariae]MCW6511930.1 ATP-binding protein [Lichenifustis flavocetrariae]